MAEIASITLAKNEEPRIEKCLLHLRNYVDWMLVIVDRKTRDNTGELAEKIADRVEEKEFSGSFAEEKNYARTLVPEEYRWLLWVDVDERFDQGFLRNIGKRLDGIKSACFRFPRCNLPDGKDYPDYQIRLFPNSQDIQWKGEIHEVPFYIPEERPLSAMDKQGRKAIIPVLTADNYPIIHLPRRKDGVERPWW